MSYLTVALLVCLAVLGGLSLWLTRDPAARRGGVPTGPADRPARIGGVSIALGVLVVGFLATRLPIGATHVTASGLLPVLAGGLLVFLIGWIDDIRPLPPIAKLVGQVAAASVTYVLGLSTGFMAPGPMNALFTIFCLVGGANALNLLDGLDGLAGGVAFFAAAAGFFIARDAGALEASVLAAALAGGCLAFLWLNLPPARVYMGDAGSNFLGFGLTAVPLLLSNGGHGFEQFSATMLLLAVPIVDTATSIGRRLAAGRSPLQGDHGHLHHRLLGQGWTIGGVLALAWGTTLLMGLLVLFGWKLLLPPFDRAIATWTALGALLIAGTLYVGLHAARLPGSPKR